MALRADYMLPGGTVITVDGERRIFRDGAVAFRGSDIVAVGKREELERSVDANPARSTKASGLLFSRRGRRFVCL
jgi:predicted amidohydrolase YtcJ